VGKGGKGETVIKGREMGSEDRKRERGGSGGEVCSS